MITPPDDLTDDELLATLRSGWDLDPHQLRYAAVGFGSHHWILTERSGRRWFVTSDVVARPGSEARLQAALDTCYQLRHRAGLDFVVAPVHRPDGGLLGRVGRHLVAVYRYLECASARSPSTDELVAMIVAVHRVGSVRDTTPVEDFMIMERGALSDALDPGRTPAPGPYGRDFVELLDHHRGALERAFTDYDRLADRLRSDTTDWVITHGEPKPDNTMITEDGPVLIDWDTVRLAPPERDVWMTDAAETYQQQSGRVIDPEIIDFYRLRWDLDDLANYSAWFTATHQATPDTKIGWDASVQVCARLTERYRN